MSVDYKNRFKGQLRVQLCRTCIQYKQERDFYMQKCKYYEKLLAEYQNKSDYTEKSVVETEEFPQSELNLKNGTEDRDDDAEQRMDNTNISISNWNAWQFVIPKSEPPDSPSPEPICYAEPEPADENVTVSEMGIITAKSEEPEVGEVQPSEQTEDNTEDANNIKMCQWMLEDHKGVLHTCGDVFVSVRELSTHVMEEHVAKDKRKSYVCLWRDCSNNGRPFKLKNTMVTHLATHTGDNPYRCTYPGCVEEFMCGRELRWHKEKHSRFVCRHPSCSRTFVAERAMSIHYHMQHKYRKITRVPAKPSIPILPVREACTSDFLRFHDELDSNKEPNTCKFPGCNRVFSSVEDLDAHLSSHRTMLMRTKDYACAFEGCTRRFANQKVLDEHVATHSVYVVELLIGKQHKGGDETVIRKDAGTELESQGKRSGSRGNCFPALNGGTQVHAKPKTPPQEPHSVPTRENGEPKEPEGPNKPPEKKAKTVGYHGTCYQVCQWKTENEVCGVTLSVDDLLTHVSENHAGPEHFTRHMCMWHACDRNDRVFFFKRHLMAHIQEHVCGNLFRCKTKTCGQWFPTELELSQHRRGHDVFYTPRPNLPCPHKPCHRRFWTSENLRRHVVNKHNQEHRCPDESCGMVFKTKDRMNEHNLRVHQGVELYKCTLEGCGRAFNCRKHLNRHVRLVHLQEKKFRCTVPGCNMEFAYSRTYKLHRKTHLGSSQ